MAGAHQAQLLARGRGDARGRAPDCGEDGAVCAADGRALFNTASATVGGPVRVRVEGGRAREGRDESLDFTVSLSRAARDGVSVDYETADGTATAGEDYTAVSGTLVFPPGETERTVAVAILDDAIDEGRETFFLRLSNPQGAYLRNIHREAKGVIVNDDPLQKMWLSRFGRTVGSQVTDAVSERLGSGLAPGAQVTLAGQALDLSRRRTTGKALAEAMTGLARAFRRAGGARGERRRPVCAHPRPVERPRGGLRARALDDRARAAAREFLPPRHRRLGARVRGLPPGAARPSGASTARRLTATDRMRVDGEVLTGVLGADADWGRLLAGVAVSLSEGDGTFDSPGVDTGTVESTMTTVSPYLRFEAHRAGLGVGPCGLGAPAR